MPKTASVARKVWIIAGITLVFLVGVGLLVLRDIGPVDDSDLALSPREVDPAQNPFPDLRLFTLPDDDLDRISRGNRMLQGKEPLDEAYLDELIEEFASERELFDRYAGMTDWQFDEEIRFTTLMDFISPWMRVAELKYFEFRRHLAEGKTDEAIEDALSLVRFGHGMQSARGTLILSLVGIAITERGHQALVEILQSGRLDEAQLNNLALRLDERDFSDELITDALRIEYQSFKLTVEDIASGKESWSGLTGGSTGGPLVLRPGVPEFLNFKKNRTILLFADSYRQMILEVPLPRSEAPRLATRKAEEILKDRWRHLVSGNAVGIIIFGVGIPAIDSMADRFSEQQIIHDLTRLQVALLRYRAEEGTYPESLDSLVPKYLPAIPLDEMDGKPLRFNSDAKILYSVGNDFRDDGGVPPGRAGGLKNRKEIAIELEPSPSPSAP